MIRTRILFALPLLLFGCSDHLSTQDAYERCDVLLSGVVSTDDPDDDTFAQCIACHEDCGDDCDKLETVPVTFSCPD